MRKLASLTAAAALVAVFGFAGTAMAQDPGADAVATGGDGIANATCTGSNCDGQATDALEAPDATEASLGDGGFLVLNFTDNVCVVDVGADVTVTEGGNDEDYTVDVGLIGGTLSGSPQNGSGTDNIDLSPTSAVIFNQIRIDDDASGEAVTTDRGADIDAVECLSSAIPITIDIKFLSDPNGYNCRKRGVVPVTIFGTATFDVNDIDVSTLELIRLDGATGDNSVSSVGPPTSSSIEDRGDPSDAGINVDGVDVFNVDGFDDLDVGFDSRDVADLIGCDSLDKRDLSPVLIVIGELNDSTLIASVPTGDSGADQLFIQRDR